MVSLLASGEVGARLGAEGLRAMPIEVARATHACVFKRSRSVCVRPAAAAWVVNRVDWAQA